MQLPPKAYCAFFTGKSRLSVPGVHLSSTDMYTTLIVTFKATKQIVSSPGENIITDCDRALTVVDGDMLIFGTSTSSMRITPPKKLNEWNTVFVQWGSDEDPSGHVYMEGNKHVEFTSNKGRSHFNELHIGGLSDDIPGFMNGYISTLEVYLTESPIPGEIRKLIMEDHQNTVKAGSI